VKEAELIELLKLSPQDIWKRDLDSFLTEWLVRNYILLKSQY